MRSRTRLTLPDVHAATTVPDLSVAAILTDEDRRTLDEISHRAQRENTVRAYNSDLRYFAAWLTLATGRGLTDWMTDAAGRCPLPVDALLKFVAHHLYKPDHPDTELGMPAEVRRSLSAASLLRTPLPHAPSTVARRLVAIGALHKQLDLPSPAGHPHVRRALQDAKRAYGFVPSKKSPRMVDMAIVDRLVAVCDASTLAGARDRLLVLFMFASGGRRRSELRRIRVRHFHRVDGGYLVDLPPTKTTEAEDQVQVPFLYPEAEAFDYWRRFAVLGVDSPVFLAVDRHDRILGPLSGEAVNRALKRIAKRAGLDPREISSHGVRAGFYTDCSRRGISLEDAMQLTVAKDRRTAAGYFRPCEVLKNPAARLRVRRDE